jgi:multiple inositol-polyphosphate phosphatase/2,3-bisphosphoglycerate 3-phosphatase
MVVRHGSRYPSNKQANKSVTTLERLKSYLTNPKSLLNDIKDTFKNKPHYGLTDLGAYEMRTIADRFKKRYSNLFSKVDIDQIDFMSSSKPRSMESGLNFTTTLFSHLKDDIVKSLKINDNLLRGFDHCKKYVKEVQLNDGLHENLNLFKRSEYVEKLIQDFKKRHFIDDDVDLHIGKLILICTGLEGLMSVLSIFKMNYWFLLLYVILKMHIEWNIIGVNYLIKMIFE